MGPRLSSPKVKRHGDEQRCVRQFLINIRTILSHGLAVSIITRAGKVGHSPLLWGVATLGEAGPELLIMFFYTCLFLSIFSLIAVFLCYFVIFHPCTAVSMRKCCGQHTCMSYISSIAISNGSFVFPLKARGHYAILGALCCCNYTSTPFRCLSSPYWTHIMHQGEDGTVSYMVWLHQEQNEHQGRSWVQLQQQCCAESRLVVQSL